MGDTTVGSGNNGHSPKVSYVSRETGADHRGVQARRLRLHCRPVISVRLHPSVNTSHLRRAPRGRDKTNGCGSSRVITKNLAATGTLQTGSLEQPPARADDNGLGSLRSWDLEIPGRDTVRLGARPMAFRCLAYIARWMPEDASGSSKTDGATTCCGASSAALTRSHPLNRIEDRALRR